MSILALVSQSQESSTATAAILGVVVFILAMIVAFFALRANKRNREG
ncbi:hypothetical protein [Jatrophihabitans sp.]|nr:hypothetical protein [Jatrophihabitans sp.]